MEYIVTTSKEEADLVASEFWDSITATVANSFPEDVEDGTIIGRNAATGELSPDSQRTTAWGESAPTVEGWAVPLPQPEDARGALVPMPAVSQADQFEVVTPWPAQGPIEQSPPPSPEPWVQPQGAHDSYPEGVEVTHSGQTWVSVTRANVWEPGVFGWEAASDEPPAEGPQPWVQPVPGLIKPYAAKAQVTHENQTWRSLIGVNVWEPGVYGWELLASAPTGPQPWVQPTGAHDAYAIGDEVTHTVSGRTTTIWRSNIPANTTEPGTDSTFDRWWAPVN